MVKKIDLSRDKIDFGTEKIVGLFLNRSKFVFNETDGRFAGLLWPGL